MKIGTLPLLKLEQLSALYQNRSWAVCQIREEKKGDSDWGTGFLIGGHFLITNFHVIPDLKTAQKSEAVFRRVIEQDVDGKYKHTDERRISLKDAQIFCSSPNNPKQEGDKTVYLPADADHLDFTILSLTPNPFLDQIQNRVFNIFEHAVPQKNTPVAVFHYPKVFHSNTSTEQDVKFSSGLVNKVEGYTITYDADTSPGSSGSPVLNEKGELIALHHQALGKKDLDPGDPLPRLGFR